MSRKAVHVFATSDGMGSNRSACGKPDVVTSPVADNVTCGACRGTSLYMAAAHKLPKGAEATKPERQECPHGERWQWFRWTWFPDRGETEAESEPEILSSPTSCHACNCDDPFCAKCENPL